MLEIRWYETKDAEMLPSIGQWIMFTYGKKKFVHIGVAITSEFVKIVSGDFLYKLKECEKWMPIPDPYTNGEIWFAREKDLQDIQTQMLYPVDYAPESETKSAIIDESGFDMNMSEEKKELENDDNGRSR